MPTAGAALVLILAAILTLGLLALGMAGDGGGGDPTIVAVAGGVTLFGAMAAAIKKQVG